MANDEDSGPLILFMASVLEKPKMVFGVKSVERNIQASRVIWPIVGAVLGLILALPLYILVHSLLVLVWSPIFIGAITLLMSEATPPAGEKSFVSWLRIWIKGQRGMTRVGGERAKVYLDLALLHDPEDGVFYVEVPTVPVAKDTVDRYGLFM